MGIWRRNANPKQSGNRCLKIG